MIKLYKHGEPQALATQIWGKILKIEPIIEAYTIRTNYFVEYLHYDDNGRLDGFMDHKNNMYVLNNEYENRKSICERLYKIYKSYDFVWCNQSYTSLATSLFNT